MKKSIRIAIGLLISITFLYLSYKSIGSLKLKELVDFPIRYILVLLSILFFILGCFFRAATWNKGFNQEITPLLAFKGVCIGMAVSMTLPFKMGEAARVFVMGNNKKVKYSNIITNLALERFLDVIILLCLLVITLFITGFEDDLLQGMFRFKKYIAMGTVLIIITGVVIYKVKKEWFIKSFSFFKGIDIINKPILFINVIINLLLSWACMYVSGVLVLLSTGIRCGTSLSSALVILVLTNLVMLVPAAPGGLGVFQYSVIYSLGLFSVTGIHAAVLSVLMHLVQYIAVIPLGLYFSLVGKYNYSVIKKGGRKLKEDVSRENTAKDNDTC